MKNRTVQIVIAVVVVVLFAVTYFGVLANFQNEAAKQATAVVAGDPNVADQVVVYATVLSVDPIKGDMVVRLNFEPKGAFATQDGRLAQDLTMQVFASSGNMDRTFGKGKLMNPTEVTLGMYDGAVTAYPFDQYKADLVVLFEQPVKDAAPKPVASTIDFWGSAHGLKISAAPEQEAEAADPALSVTVTRSSTTVFFAVFVMAAMWALALVALFLTLSVLFRGRKSEIGMFSYLGSMLFAFPALRNAVPGAPPIGSLNDFVALFWAEGIIAICIVLLVGTWLLRPAK